jgi:chromosome segregation protein
VRAERLSRLRAQVGAAHSKASAALEEAGRLADAVGQARTRAEQAQQDYEELQELCAGRDDDRAGLAGEHDQASARLAEASAMVSERRAAEREASAQRAALQARVQALREGVHALRTGKDASGTLLADPEKYPGVLGGVAALVSVDAGAQEAIAAALGGAADAVAVTGLDAAVAILEALKGEDAGSAGLMIASGSPASPATPADGGLPPGVQLPDGAQPALALVRVPDGLAPALAGLLAGIVVAADLSQARDLVRAHPALRVVTRQGDVLGAHWASGGSARPASQFTLRSVADEAAAGLEAVEERCEQAAGQLTLALEAEDRARQVVAKAQAALREVDAAAAEVSGRLGRLAGAARAARDEAQRLEAAIEKAHRAHEASQASVAELEASLAGAEAAQDAGDQPRPRSGLEADAAGPQDEAEPAPDRDGLAGRVTAARNAEMEARLEVRTAEERLRAIAGRADALVAAATAERQAAQRAAARRVQRERQAVVARAVADGAAHALVRLADSLAAASEARQGAEQASKGRAVALKEVRVQVRELATDFDRVVDAAHGTEMARAEHRMRLEQLAARAAEEFAVSAEELVVEYGPAVPVPVISPDAPASGPDARASSPAPPVEGLGDGGPADDPLDGPPEAQEAVEGASEGSLPTPPALPSGEQQVLTGTIPYVRAEQERRAAAAQRQLDQLGKVNPLALEEFAALEERHAFLATQLEDLKKTRRDLLTVVKEVDDRVQEVFASAFEDTAREFEGIFSRLFPGGEGRLILTEPDDMLATGIDFEARPPGKKVKRMSLLSGGERSLTAIAFLLAIFKARPSPFYVLDEVEAALDDTNMQRLLHIFEELRSVSQLLIITHQKRTMEIADALYGISMRGDGVSAVVSQRLRERETA